MDVGYPLPLIAFSVVVVIGIVVGVTTGGIIGTLIGGGAIQVVVVVVGSGIFVPLQSLGQ